MWALGDSNVGSRGSNVGSDVGSRDEDLDALAAQIEGAGSNKEPGKGKKKKKAQKKDDFE